MEQNCGVKGRDGYGSRSKGYSQIDNRTHIFARCDADAWSLEMCCDS